MWQNIRNSARSPLITKAFRCALTVSALWAASVGGVHAASADGTIQSIQSGGATGGTPDSPPYVDGNVNYLGTLGTETMVYKAVTKKLEAQLQALAKQIEVERLTPSLARAKKAPSLIGVEGAGGQMTAVIRILPGADVEAKVGDVLPDGSKVLRINFDSVTVADPQGRKKRVLTVAEPVQPGAVGEIFGINRVPTMGASAATPPPVPPKPDGLAPAANAKAP